MGIRVCRPTYDENNLSQRSEGPCRQPGNLMSGLQLLGELYSNDINFIHPYKGLFLGTALYWSKVLLTNRLLICVMYCNA